MVLMVLMVLMLLMLLMVLILYDNDMIQYLYSTQMKMNILYLLTKNIFSKKYCLHQLWHDEFLPWASNANHINSKQNFKKFVFLK